MEYLIRVCFALLLYLFPCAMTLAQDAPEKKKVAVYVSGDDANEQQKKVIGSKVGTALVRSGDYALVETSKEFIDALMKEVDRQTSGEVRQNQIVALGNKYGVRYVVAIDITDFGDELYVVSRMINLETGVVGLSTDANGPGETISQLNKLSQDIVAGLLTDSKSGSNQGGVSNATGNNRVKTFTVNGVSFNMIPVAGGTYQMGSYDSEAESDERYVHNETIYDFMIGETEVTQELWLAVMGSNPSSFKGAKNPVENISWNSCRDFINRLNSLTGQNFRMPTEAEWEYAARGGSRSAHYRYSGGDNLNHVGWYYGNSGGMTHPVALKASNELGIYDMSGNVWEWTSDCYSSGYDQPRSSSCRVLRGGSWGNFARGCRAAFRNNGGPSGSFSYNGLRLAL